MSSGYETIVAKCSCTCCEKAWKVVVTTKIFVVDGEVHHYVKPQGVRCLTCNLPYLKWEKATLQIK